jgi:hypothetical protein
VNIYKIGFGLPFRILFWLLAISWVLRRSIDAAPTRVSLFSLILSVLVSFFHSCHGRRLDFWGFWWGRPFFLRVSYVLALLSHVFLSFKQHTAFQNE